MAILQQDFSLRGMEKPESLANIYNRGLGSTFDKRIAQLTADEDKAYRREQDAKQNARADTLLGMQIKDWDQKNATRQGIIDTEQAKTMAAPYVKDVVAFNDPRYAQALAAWKSAGNTDITESDKILAAYTQGNPQQQSIMRGSTDAGYVPAVGGSNTGLLSRVATGQGSAQVPYEKHTQVMQGPQDAPIDMSIQTRIPGAYKEGPMNSVRLAQIRDLDKQKDAILNDPKNYTGSPASSARDYKPNVDVLLANIDAQKKEVMRNKNTPATIGSTSLSTNVNSLDMDNIKTINGVPHVLDTKNNKYLSLESPTVQKALGEASSTMGKTKDVVSTGYRTEKLPPLPAVISGNAPAFKITMKDIQRTASSNNMPVEQVQGTIQKVGNSYQQIASMLGTDNTKERDTLRSMVASQAAQNGILPSEYDVGKAVDSILPSNDLTERQKLVAEGAMKDLTAAREEFWKNKEFNLKAAEAQWNQAYRSASLSLQRAGIKSQESMTAKLAGELALYREKKGIDTQFKDTYSASDIAKENALLKKEHRAEYDQMLADSWTGHLLNPSYESYTKDHPIPTFKPTLVKPQ